MNEAKIRSAAKNNKHLAALLADYDSLLAKWEGCPSEGDQIDHLWQDIESCYING